MLILSIETSADETGVSLIKAEGNFPDAQYEILGNNLASQIKEHTKWGGIVPNIAKREHAKYGPILLEQTLEDAGFLTPGETDISEAAKSEIKTLLEREPGMAESLISFVATHERPEIQLISVTSGPGLAPALWVGVNFAKALAKLWNIHVVPVNHMEGHILASIFDVEEDDKLSQISFPAISLLISGGHTELVLVKNWAEYEKVGQTRDDAVGEAFDKVARLMGLPYPGGPEISKLAAQARNDNLPPYKDDLPRPMLHSGDLDFSFSGLKTSVRYAIQDQNLSDTDKQALARDFDDCVTEVLIKKTKDAVDEYGAQTIIIGGGVSANQHMMQEFKRHFIATHPNVPVYTPGPGMSTDNSVMIALAGHAHHASASNPAAAQYITADGNKSLA